MDFSIPPPYHSLISPSTLILERRRVVVRGSLHQAGDHLVRARLRALPAEHARGELCRAQLIRIDVHNTFGVDTLSAAMGAQTTSIL